MSDMNNISGMNNIDDGMDNTASLAENQQSFTRSDKLLLFGAMAAGVLFDFLFYNKYPGVSVPIFVISFYGLLLAYTKPVLNKQAIFGWFLSVPVLMLSMAYFFFDNEIFAFLNIPALMLLVLIQTILITGANIFKWYSPDFLFDLLYGTFYRCFAHIARPYGILLSVLGKKKNTDGKKSVGIRVLSGILISLPLLLLLLALLASADMVFGMLVDKIPELFKGINLGEILGKVFIALVVFFISFSYIWSLGHNEKITDSSLKNAAEAVSTCKGRWDIVMVITITAAVDVLYIVFVAIQFTYLFGRLGLPDGFTYSEYARRGFFELVLVTIINIGLLACTLTFTRKEGKLPVLAFRILNTVMVCCTFVMLCSAFYRMSLYEDAYGYTFLRIMTQAFMVFLLVIFMITLARVWNDRVPLLKPYIVVAIVAFTVVNYINVDKIIVNKNIERYHNNKVIDISYFRTLSNDVVPAAVKLANELWSKADAGTTAGDHEIVAELKEFLEERERMLEKKTDWQSVSLADFRARKALKEWEDYLDK